MRSSLAAIALAAGVGTAGLVHAQVPSVTPPPQPTSPVALVDSTGKIAARPLTDSMMLLTINTSGVAAPAFIRPIYNEAARPASGLATWQSAGSVLFTSADCSTGGYIFSLGNPGVRSTTQVRTPSGIVLYVGALGSTATVAVNSILYDNGCSPVTVVQSGLLPVEVTVNLTAAYPPPLSFQ
jgi:hypothetical protein